MRVEPAAIRLTDDLMALEEQLADRGKDFCFRVNRTPMRLIDHLHTSVPIGRLEGIAGSLRNMIYALGVCEEKDINPWDEREFFHISMQAMGISYPLDMLKKVEKEDLIEAYDADRLQIFRNLRFMETSAYSLIEVSSQSWPELFKRSSAITEAMISWSDEKLWERNSVVPFTIPEHYIKEYMASSPQVIHIQFKYMAPLFQGPNRPYGFACSCRAQIVDAHSRDSKLDFI